MARDYVCYDVNCRASPKYEFLSFGGDTTGRMLGHAESLYCCNNHLDHLLVDMISHERTPHQVIDLDTERSDERLLKKKLAILMPVAA